MRTIADKYIDEGMQKGIVQGIQIGEAKGRYKEKYELAKNMLSAGSDPIFVSKVTGLSPNDINNLLKS